MKEHQYIEGYARCLKSKRAEWDKGRNVEQMWYCKRGVGSVRVGGKNRKKVLGARDEVSKEK